MSHALKALILIAVDTHDGEWVPFSVICERIAMHKLAVLDGCLQLVESCELATCEIDGQPHFGVHVDRHSHLAKAA